MTKQRFEIEMHYRNILEKWELRFHQPTSVTPQLVASARDQFLYVYGWKGERRVREEVVINCSQKICRLLDQEREQEEASQPIVAVMPVTVTRTIIIRIDTRHGRRQAEHRKLPYRRQAVFA